MKILNKIYSYFSPQPRVPFEALGGESGIKKLVDDFYQIMQTDPKAIHCKQVHPLNNEGKIPQEVIDKLYWFIVGFSGGPQLFMEKVGPPRMRMRHHHIKIGPLERDEWLYCMKKAMKRVKINRAEHKMIFNSFTALAFRIQNIQ